MADVPGNSTTDKTITVGSTIGGDLETIGDRDWYRVQLTAGQQYTILLTGVTLEDPYLRIRDAAGNLIIERDDINPGVMRDSRVSFTATTSGTYFIDVGSWEDGDTGGYTGTYQLSVQPYTPPPEYSLSEVADFLTSSFWGGDTHRFDVSQGGSVTVNITGLTAAGQSLARSALNLWTDIIGVNFVEVVTGGQIVFDDNEEGAFADGVWADGIISSANVNVSTQWLANYGTAIDSYSFQTYVHEIGHALGLGHAGYYNGSGDYLSDAIFANDGWPTTVMSYFDQSESTYFADQYFGNTYVLTPMMGDIEAMAVLYGLSTTTRVGDTIYGYGSNAGHAVYDANLNPGVSYTIFDSGGIDTLNYSGTQSQVNLNGGTYSHVWGLVGAVSIAPGVVIENFIGGSSYDEVIGNSANNVLNGGDGTDLVSYQAATAGVTVSLQLTGPQNTGGAGTDTIINFEDLRGSDHNDVLTGRSGGTVEGGTGNDVLHGVGNSYLHGQAGNDRFVISGTWGDQLFGGAGWDVVDFSQAPGFVQIILNSGGPTSTTDVEEVIGSAFNDTITGDDYGNTLRGGGGGDIITGGGGADTLNGGAGNDEFQGTLAEFNGDIITDFAAGDRIVISDASIASFTYSITGSTLIYSGGSMTLTGVTAVTVSAAAEGGVQLVHAGTPAPSMSRATLIITEGGQDVMIGGDIGVRGTPAVAEVIEIVRGDVTLDASFNLGADTVVLPGAASTYTAVLSGSIVTISGGDVSVAIPVGIFGLYVQFADSTRILVADLSNGQVTLGDQQISGTVQPVAASGPPLNDHEEFGPDSFAKLILTAPGQDVDVGGNVSVTGTSSPGEVVTVLGGDIRLDASFNGGGDAVVLPGTSGAYTASLAGSFVTITDGEHSVAIPVGTVGLTVDFSDMDLTLRVDTATGTVRLGDLVVTAASQPLTPGLPAMEQLFGKADGDAEVAAAVDSFDVSAVTLEIDNFSFG